MTYNPEGLSRGQLLREAYDTPGATLDPYDHEAEQVQWEYENRYAPAATMGEAHAEWHRNSGVPMGTPGCPQDACHPVDDFDPPTVKCGNKAAHGKDGSISYPYHYSTAEVRECYAATGRFAGDTAPSLAHARQVAQRVAAEAEAEQARVHAAVVAAQQEEARKEAAKVRYQMWRSIPVYSRNKGYYALVVDGKTHFYRVDRPTKGKHAGRTFAKEQASDTFYDMSWTAQGAALDAIAADPAAAAALYAQTIEQCSACGRTLTDDVSIARAMGPDCAAKYGA